MRYYIYIPSGFTAIETSGFVKLSNPGRVEITELGNIKVTMESSEVFTNDASFIVSSDADFDATSRWKPVIPSVNQGFQMKLDIREQVGSEDLEIIYIELYNMGSLPANYFGVEEGLYVIFDRYNPNGIRFEEQQLFRIDNPSPSDGILLSLSYSHDTNQIIGTFSMDGGQTVISPFDPITAHLDEGVFDDWELNGFSHEFEVIPERCKYLLVGDLNWDCRVNLADLSIMAANWLKDCIDNPLASGCRCDIPWVAEPPMNIARDQFAGGVIDGKIYVFGGNGNPDGSDLNSTEMYDPTITAPETNPWTILSDNPHINGSGVEELTSAVVNNKLYVFGADKQVFNEMYDTVTNTWTTLAPKPTFTRAGPATVYNDEIYIFGGYSNSTDPELYNEISDVVECYSPSTDTWRFVTNIPQAISNFGVSIIGHKAYLLGGFVPETSSLQDVVIAYNFQTDTWTTSGYQLMPVQKAFPYSVSAPVIDNKIYLIGGWELGNEFVANDRVDIYDPATNTWEEGTPLPLPLGDHVSLKVGNKIYVLGGDHNENFYNRAKSEVISLDTDFCSQ